MSASTFSRAATAVALLASTASAAWSASSTQNVAMYWGQGSNQIPLSEVCADPSIDVVNIGFVTQFPLKRGDYPATNFANACWGTYYVHPTDKSQDNKLLKDCPSIEPGIAICKANGKKVLLSLGGGASNNYYIPNQDVATYFAEFLIGAFGPAKADWVNAGKPRPWGNAAVDGFDLDLEADEKMVPAGGISANYAFFVNELKRLQSSLLISAAPQCPVPDARLADAISKAPFDMIFTQFYNTPQCSARLGYQQINSGSTGFTYNTWADWLKTNSKNPQVKLYLGLGAGPDGLPDGHKGDYLKPDEAAALITKWKSYGNNFGGVMLWEATVSAKNLNNCKSYAYWMKSTLQGQFNNQYSKGCVVSSSVAPSSTKASSTKVSSTAASSTKVSSSAVSSTKASSSAVSSTKASSSAASSTKISSAASSTQASSSAASSPASSSGHATSSSASVHVSSSATVHVSSSASVHVSSSASVHVSSSASVHVSSTPSAHPSSSASASIYSASTPGASSSAPHSSAASSSSAHDVSSSPVPHPSSSISNSPYPSGSATTSVVYPSSVPTVVYPSSVPTGVFPSSVHTVVYPSSVPTVVYPQDTTKDVYPHSTSDVVYPSQSSSATWPSYNNASTSCSTSTKVSSTPVPYYDASSTPGYPVYEASSTPGSPVYGASSSPAPYYPGYPVYGASSSPAPYYPGSPASSSVKAYDAYPPSVTSKPGQDYPSYPASSTIKVVTTTYVDSCETGVTTKTETITQTICAKCQDSVTSTYVCAAGKCGPSVVTVTITKPYSPPTDVPAKPSSPPTYGGDKPQPPAKPSSPPTYGGDKPAPPAQPSVPAKPSSPPTYDVPKKQDYPVASTTVSIVYITKTPVPVVPVSSVKYTPIPYPSAPAKNGTSGYPVKPTGTGAVPSKATGYSPPQFTGAATQVSVGMTGLLAIVAGLMAL